MRVASDVSLSPDGKRLAIAVQFADREKDEYRSVIVLVDAETGAQREYTDPSKRSWSPTFSPDGASLAFVSDRSGVPQVWAMRLDGGEPQQRTHFVKGAESPVWSPDSRRIAFLSAGGERETPDAHTGEKSEKARVKVVRRIAYREDGRGYFHDSPNHVFVVAAVGGDPVQLSSGDDDDRRPKWSPDGKGIAFLSNRTGDPSLDTTDVWVVPSDGGSPRSLTPSKQVIGGLAWSPDGAELAVVGHDHPRTPGDRTIRVGFVRATGGDVEFVTDSEGPSYASLLIGPGHSDFYPNPCWTHRGVLAIAHAAGRQHVHVVGRKGKVEPIASGDLTVWSFDATADGKNVAFVASTIDQPPNLFRIRPDGLRKLTDLNPWMNEVEQPDVEVFQCKAPDGAALDAWIVNPPGAPSDKALPLLLVVHGGPHCAFGYSWRFQAGPLAQAGYRSLLVNPRGSSGYGEKFMMAIHPATGDLDQGDLLAAVDAAIARGGVDPKRIGVTGGSYGGFMTNLLLGRTDRFRAGVTIATISNWFSFYGTCDHGWEVAWEFGAEPWVQGKYFAGQSPITYASTIKAPLLILHGEDDLRCPIEQGEQLFAVLQRRGIPSEMRRYPGEPHGLGSRHPSFRDDVLRATIDWFDKYLQ